MIGTKELIERTIESVNKDKELKRKLPEA